MPADKRDEIISMQLDLIRQMTENNIKRLSSDIWGSTRTGGKTDTKAPQIPSEPASPVSDTTRNPDVPKTKAADGGDGGNAPAEKEEQLIPDYAGIIDRIVASREIY